MTIRMYRGYPTGAGWTLWGASEADVLNELMEVRGTGSLTLQQRDGAVAVYEDGEGEEFGVEWFDIEPTPENLVKFLTEFCEC